MVKPCSKPMGPFTYHSVSACCSRRYSMRLSATVISAADIGVVAPS